MKKFIINIIVLFAIVLPLTLLTMSGISYAILLTKFEPTKEIKIMNDPLPKSIKTQKLQCDGCMKETNNLTQHTLKDINTKVNLCDDCLEVFTELEKEN